jgi:hypothetical protein
MKHGLTVSFAAIALLAGVNCAQGSTISYTIQLVADNDFAVFAGTANSITSLIYQNDVSWPSQISAASSQSFTLQPDETTFYVLGMGGGGQENISGTLNGVDITNIPVLMSSDLSKLLSGYDLNAVAGGTYSASLADVQTAFPDLTWGQPVLTTSDAVVNLAAPNNIGYHFDPGTAHLFEFDATDVSGVPEPSTWLLGMIGGVAILLGRWRRTSSPRIPEHSCTPWVPGKGVI